MKRRKPLGLTSFLASNIRSFVAQKRTNGRRYLTEEITLRLFDRYLVERDIDTVDDVTSDVIDAFLATRPRKRPRSYNHLVGVLGVFFDWLVVRGVFVKSPVRARRRRGGGVRTPVILHPVHIRRLLDLTAQLSDEFGGELRAKTYRTVFALLYALGLRVGEVCRLCVGDIDWDRRLLVIRDSKFGKTRLVPFGPRVTQLLTEHIEARRARYGALAAGAPIFSVSGKHPLNRQSIGKVFRQLRGKLGIILPCDASPARVHDLRHSFAVRTLLRWYRAGIDPSHRLIHLSTFMGHVQPGSTAVYLTITDELLNIAGAKFEQTVAAVLPRVMR